MNTADDDRSDKRPRGESPPRQGPLGDVIPSPTQSDPRARRGQPMEDVEDRPVVGQVTPEDYPDRHIQADFGQNRAKGAEEQKKSGR